MILVHVEGLKLEVFHMSRDVGKVVSTLKIDGREYDGSNVVISSQHLRAAADYIDQCELEEKLDKGNV